VPSLSWADSVLVANRKVFIFKERNVPYCVYLLSNNMQVTPYNQCILSVLFIICGSRYMCASWLN
jgi:hypothetical protein